MVISVISGKGGVGKSTVSCGLGAALTTLGKKVLLIDCDSKLRCLDLMLSTNSRTAFDLTDVLNGECEMNEAAVAVENTYGLYVVSAPRDSIISENPSALKDAVEKAKELFDIIILDSPAGVGKEFEATVSSADLTLVVATPEPVSIRDAETAGMTAEGINPVETRLIINKLNYELVKKRLYANADNVIDGTKVQLLGIVPDDIKAHESAIKGTPLKKGRAARAFTRISRRINGEFVPLPKAKKI